MGFRGLRRILLMILLAMIAGAAPAGKQTRDSAVRATLENGLRVVIVRDPLAPVVTVEENYLAGGDETPAGFPGMAHAQEHMAFRGCAGLSADQIAAIYAQLGGRQNADTQQNITQYFVTVPAQDLEVALRAGFGLHAGRRGLRRSNGRKSAEPSSRRFRATCRIPPTNSLPASTKTSSPARRMRTTRWARSLRSMRPPAPCSRSFIDDWYAPNNAILVISGDVDPASALAKVRQLYGPIKRKPLPARPEIHLPPVKADSFTLDSNLPYELVFVAFRMPGTSSPDFAAVRILSDVIGSQRADLYGLVPLGKALGTEFGVAETYPKASVGFAAAAVPAAADPAPITAEMKSILAGYAAKGVPAELVDAAKKGEIADAEFQRNSISDLAAVWSQALADEGRQSPDDLVEAMKKVTLADVNRVAKTYLSVETAVVATLKPSASGEAVAGKGFGGAEVTTAAPTKPRCLARLGGSLRDQAESAGSAHASRRCDSFERLAPDRENGKGQPDGHRDRLRQTRAGSADSTRQGWRR